MKPFFVTVKGLRLSYLIQNENCKHTIFFIHGNSGSSRMWQKQLESALLGNYRLIAIDLPGHGKSDPSKNPKEDYSPIGTAQILSLAVKELTDNDSYILTGFSYGTNLVAEMLSNDIVPSGIVLVGACVLGENYGMDKVFVQNSSASIFFYNEPDSKIVANFFRESIHSANEEDRKNSAEDYLKVSSVFKPTIFQTAAEGKISDEIRNLQNLNLPVCLIFGKRDNLVNIDYLDGMPFPVWRNQIHKLPETGHWANIDNPHVFNQLISDYAIEGFTASRV